MLASCSRLRSTHLLDHVRVGRDRGLEQLVKLLDVSGLFVCQRMLLKSADLWAWYSKDIIDSQNFGELDCDVRSRRTKAQEVDTHVHFCCWAWRVCPAFAWL